MFHLDFSMLVLQLPYSINVKCVQIAHKFYTLLALSLAEFYATLCFVAPINPLAKQTGM
jgi:hypothetical protein